MPTLQELEPQALALTQHERAELAASLLSSLPPILNDEDEGVAEALRREAEIDADPSAAISLAEFEQGISALRSQ
jgi:putative addiction module component (TIGR02574 family)